MQTGRCDSLALLRAAAVSVAVVGVLYWSANRFGIRINLSPSLPIGLYQVASGSDATLVEFCPPEPFGSLANVRGYRQPGNCPDGGAPLMKPVVAWAGDVVSLSEKGVVVNGQAIPNSAPLTRDSAGRPLTPWPFGLYTSQLGTVWVVSDYHPRSFDSRYFGPIPETLIRNRLRPLLRCTPPLTRHVTARVVDKDDTRVAFATAIMSLRFRQGRPAAEAGRSR
jgi:conjugative transfer signal peptidase TraF